MATTNTETQAGEQTATDRAKEEAGRVGDVAKDEMNQLVGEARDQGRALLSEASDRLKGEAQHQSQRVAENFRSLSSDLRTMSQSAEGSGTAATWVRMGADRFDGLAERLEKEGFDGVVNDVGDFARRSPMAFLALTFGAGLIAGRVIKNRDTTRSFNPALEAGSAPKSGGPLETLPAHANGPEPAVATT